jgi:lipopolysaccharide export system protein LptA
MRKFIPLLALAPFLAVPASGQALKGHNSNAPVDVQADRIEAGLNLNAARLTVAYDKAGGGRDITRIDASGGVSVTSATESARGEFAVYDLPRKLITLVGGVTLVQGANRINGGRLVIDLTSGRAVVDGNATGVPGVEGGSGGGRVSGRFTVSKRDQ